MYFEIIGEITGIEIVASGRGLRDRKRLWKIHGKGQWRKKKGLARVRLSDGTMCSAELHWYEAHGIGSKEFKIKRLFE